MSLGCTVKMNFRSLIVKQLFLTGTATEPRLRKVAIFSLNICDSSQNLRRVYGPAVTQIFYRMRYHTGSAAPQPFSCVRTRTYSRYVVHYRRFCEVSELRSGCILHHLTYILDMFLLRFALHFSRQCRKSSLSL